MANRSSSKGSNRPVTAEERRIATRLTPADVPWIKEVKPTAAHTGKLIDISQTGVLLETSARLLPGRRSTMLLTTDDDRRERVEVIVVRTQLVGVGTGGELMYRTGLTYAKALPEGLRQAVERDIAAKLARQKVSAEGMAAPATTVAQPAPAPAPAPAAAPVAAASAPVEPEALVSHVPQQPQLDGPFDSLWTTEAGSELVAVASVTETGCVAQTPTGGAVGGAWTVRIFFSASRQLTLTGAIASLTADGTCVFQFANLTAADRRALRVEIHGGAGHRAAAKSAAPATTATGKAPVSNLSINLTSASVSLTANQW